MRQRPKIGTYVGIYGQREPADYQIQIDWLEDRIKLLSDLLKRCLPIVQYDAQMMADITRFAPLPAEDQAKHDSTEYESEKLLREIPEALKDE